MPGRQDSGETGELYGILEAMRRARGWMLHLSPNQQRVYSTMMLFCSVQGVMTPTASQIADLANLKKTTVRTRLYEIRKIGALVEVGSRPWLDDEGVAHGHRIPRYSIPLSPSEVKVGDPHYHPEGVPPSPRKRATVTSGSDTLNLERLKGSSEHKTGGRSAQQDPATCRHTKGMTGDGDCLQCGAEGVA